MLRKIFLSLALVSFLCPGVAVAQLADTPWPKFHYDIHNTGKTTNLGTTVGKLKWKFVTGGAVTSSPVLDDNGTLYIGSDDNNIYAIDTETGALKWKYKTEKEISRASGAIDVNNMLYFGSNDGYLYAFDLDDINPLDPQPKMVFNTSTEITGKATTSSEKPSYAISSSPSISDDGVIYFSSNNGYLYALNSDFTLKWKYYISMSWASPAIDERKNVVYGAGWGYQTYDCPDPDNASLTVPCFASIFMLDKDSGALYDSTPDYACPPGGIMAAPVIAPNGDIIISWVAWENIDWEGCDDECVDNPVWRISIDPTVNDINGWICYDYGYKQIYSTPAMIEDNSYYVISGADVIRVLPDGTGYHTVTTIGERSESSPAVDGQKNLFIGSNGGYFYAICTECPETPLLWQYPGPEEDPLQITRLAGTTTIASILSSPAIGDDSRHSVYVGASDGCVYAFYDGASIEGRVTQESNGAGIQGVEMTLTSTFTDQVRTTYIDTNGYYSFTGVENYTYTITPKKVGYVFTPQTRTAVIKQDQDALNMNFTAFDGFTITGKVLDAEGAGFSNVMVYLQGDTTKYSATAVTDSSGSYSFTGLGYDVYSLTPELTGYSFDPASQSVTIATSTSITNKNFTAKDFTVFQGYQISGMIMDVRKLESQNSGISGITINLTGTANDGQSVNVYKTSDSEGKYSFTGLSNGAYMVKPSQSSTYTFEPTSQDITIASANVLNVDFYAGTGFAISGSIQLDSADNATYSSVSVDLFNDNATYNLLKNIEKTPINSVVPDKDGNFVFIGVGPGNYVVKPSLNGYGFNPQLIKVTVSTSSVTNLLFVAEKGYYISGTISSLIGTKQENVPIQLIPIEAGTAGTAVSTITNSSGIYSFTGLDAGDYIVGLSEEYKNYYQLYPEAWEITITSESKEDVDFRIKSYCSITYFNVPFVGIAGTLVHIFGTNFGWSEPPDNETMNVSMGDQQEELPSGVYFGTDDLTTWAKADVVSWSPVKIVVEAPPSTMMSPFNLVRVWVIRRTRSEDTAVTETDLAGCYGAMSSDFFLYIY